MPGAVIRTAGQPPVYSAAAGEGTNSVEAGAITLNAAQARGVNDGPGVAWGSLGRSSSGASGSGASENPGF